MTLKISDFECLSPKAILKTISYTSDSNQKTLLHVALHLCRVAYLQRRVNQSLSKEDKAFWKGRLNFRVTRPPITTLNLETAIKLGLISGPEAQELQLEVESCKEAKIRFSYQVRLTDLLKIGTRILEEVQGSQKVASSKSSREIAHV